jgi:asparagine synthase (glutamine-hydrolysing)
VCGLCGFLGSPQPDLLHRMLGTLEHRGPDDVGIFVTSNASLGARRLAIIDVHRGRQPALSEDERVAAVLNGEIYNYRDLRTLLERRGHSFRSSSDTEVLPHLYEEFGTELTALLRGMFAIAIWDDRERRLLLARDRAGEKPLFYADTNEGLVFASELKAVLAHPEVDRELDPESLALYLQLQYVPGPATMIASVRKLPPGNRLVAEGGLVRVNRYWDVVPSEPSHFRSPRGAAEELRELLEDAVSSQVHADRPVGALLSGGLDSAGIVSLMARVAAEPPRTFTVGFEDDAFDERAPARKIANSIGTRHTELVIEPPSFDDLERLAWYLDEPVGDQAALPTYLIAQVASEHVTVVLTGEGSDELFGGYPRYRWFHLADRLDILPAPMRESLRTVGALLGRGRDIDLLLRPRKTLERHVAWTHVFDAAGIDNLLAPDLGHATSVRAADRFRAVLGVWGDRPPLEQAMYLDLKTWLVDNILTKADRMSMAWSIEARAPYLDHRVVEFATSLPPSARVHGLETKPLLREALAPIVPSSALRSTKTAFRVPVERWLGGQLAEPLRELLLSRDAETRQLLQPDKVAHLLSETGREAGQRIWTLAILELWLRQVVRAPLQAPATVRA